MQKGESIGVTYKRLRKLLIDKDMTKGNLRSAASVAASTISRMSRNEYVSIEVLEEICSVMDCEIGDILEFEKESHDQEIARKEVVR